ncbi:MAG: FadR family transcriptional regulator [Deltaproteobacteria bacterium]|nr:FadR family transcriptional regulator [Deltaproteobacteria bacterium]MBW1935425.1 FadR family transcriptional regulator [Deltaproteobacteria bacterium]MBW1978337.1 FadR family transcriptional regulator [Deltaproteobacteria bacterium]MBW2299567.1 FadR family transcriptional regulator [Deltaproteobacteria bacterium]RLB32900.1 MAG: FadR family transcriptional regulator [Deltaproteobacteria bacterium]
MNLAVANKNIMATGVNNKTGEKDKIVRPIFKPIKQEKLSDKIANQIKSLIASGELGPGDQLPPERELMRLLNVSRPSLREALNSLVSMGFLQVTQGSRTVVKSLAHDTLGSPITHLLKDNMMGTLFELIEVRKAIEAWSAFHAAQVASPEDIASLEATLQLMQEDMGREEFGPLVKDDADFHLGISEATHNRVQTHIMFTIYDLIRQSIGKYYKDIDYKKIYEQHVEILEAIREKEPETARARMLSHLDYVKVRLKEVLGVQEN